MTNLGRPEPFADSTAPWWRAPVTGRPDRFWAGVLVAYLCVFNFFYLDHNDFLYVGAVVHEGTLCRDLHYTQARWASTP